MKSAKKIITWIAGSILAILLVLIIGFNIFGAGIIKTVVEKAASSTLGVPVKVKSISLALLRGKVEIQGLVVNNPSGYDNPTLLELGDGVVKLDVGSLMSDTIKIELIKLDGTKLTMEQKGLTNNLKEILDKLPKGEEQAKPKPEEKGKGKNLNIARLEITNTNVKVKLLPIPGKSDTVSINIDPIIMTDLGGDKKIDMSGLTAKILGAIARGVAKQGTGLLPDDMVGGIGSSLGKTTEGGKKILETSAGAGKDVIKGVTGLFGGKKNEPNK